jgi:predicted Rossmann fold nucleotide-binding protein DprA/Smf involved in DNA uptake
VASFVDSTVKEIEKRLGELRHEVSRLEGALAALGAARRGPGRPRGSGARRTTTRRTTTARRGGARRARRGGNTRANQALELVRQKPGITIPEIAKEMSIQPNYLYRVLPRLEKEGKVRKEGQGWHGA